MATKKEKHKKAVKHAQRMTNKQLDKAFYEGVEAGCVYTLKMSYMSLASEDFKFDMERLSKYRIKMDRYSLYYRDGLLDNSEIDEVMKKKGIDMAKIGDDYVNELWKKAEVQEH